MYSDAFPIDDIVIKEIEASLHCIMSVQEALPLEDNPLLSQLFGVDILKHMPTVGQDRVRRTMLSLIGAFFVQILARVAHVHLSYRHLCVMVHYTKQDT